MSSPLDDARFYLPRSESGTIPDPGDIGKVIEVVFEHTDGPNQGNVEVSCGRLVGIWYSPAEVHSNPQVHMPAELRQALGVEETEPEQHIDPESLTFAFEGGLRLNIQPSAHRWRYTVR